LRTRYLSGTEYWTQKRFRYTLYSYVYRLYVSRQSARPMSINKDLVAASSTPLVLAILAEGDSYGYAILKRVRELSGGELEWTDGMLYPVLHRLERSGLIEARWDQAES